MFYLPDGWEERFNEEQKRHYYVNHNTKTTQWERPMETYVAPPAFAPPDYTSNLNHFYTPFADTEPSRDPKVLSMISTDKLRLLGFDSAMFGHVRGAIQQSGLSLKEENSERYKYFSPNVSSSKTKIYMYKHQFF